MRSSTKGARVGWLLFLSFSLACVLTKLHLETIDMPNRAAQQELHAAILRHEAPAPYQYRILQPVMVDLISRLLGLPGNPRAFVIAYALIRLLCIWATCIAFYLFLASHLNAAGAALGVAMLAALIPFTYQRYYYQPSSIMELACFAIGLLCIARGGWLWLTVIVVVGALNRETMVFLPVLWVLWWWPPSLRRDWGAVVALAGGGAVFLLLRALWPTTANLSADWQGYVHHNLADARGSVDVALMTLPWLAWGFCPHSGPAARFRRLMLFYVLWTPFHFLFARWAEVRYFLPPLLVAIPGLLMSVVPEAMRRDANPVE